MADLLDLIQSGNLPELAKPQATHSSVQSVGDAASSAVDFYGVYTGKAPKLTAIGYLPVDKYMGGVNHDQLVVFAARPGVGKSWFALNCAMRAARLNSQRVAYLTLEDGLAITGVRALAIASKLDESEIRLHSTRNTLTQPKLDLLQTGLRSLADVPLSIYAPESSDGLRVLNTLRYASEEGAQLVFIDYLQYMRGGQDRNGIDDILNGLVEFAKSTKIPVVVVSQLRRPREDPKDRSSNDEGEGGSVPKLVELKGSGSLEEKGKVVVGLWGTVEKIQTKVLKTNIGRAGVGANFTLCNGFFEPL